MQKSKTQLETIDENHHRQQSQMFDEIIVEELPFRSKKRQLHKTNELDMIFNTNTMYQLDKFQQQELPNGLQQLMMNQRGPKSLVMSLPAQIPIYQPQPPQNNSFTQQPNPNY